MLFEGISRSVLRKRVCPGPRPINQVAAILPRLKCQQGAWEAELWRPTTFPIPAGSWINWTQVRGSGTDTDHRHHSAKRRADRSSGGSRLHWGCSRHLDTKQKVIDVFCLYIKKGKDAIFSKISFSLWPHHFGILVLFCSQGLEGSVVHDSSMQQCVAMGSLTIQHWLISLDSLHYKQESKSCVKKQTDLYCHTYYISTVIPNLL